jgi:hypothetical protein
MDTEKSVDPDLFSDKPVESTSIIDALEKRLKIFSKQIFKKQPSSYILQNKCGKLLHIHGNVDYHVWNIHLHTHCKDLRR